MAWGSDLLNCGMEETIVAVAWVVKQGSLLHQAAGAQAADNREHQALHHFDPFPFRFSPWFDAFGTVSFAVGHDNIAEHCAAGDDFSCFLPAVIAGEHSAAAHALLFRIIVVLSNAFAHTERNAQLSQDFIGFFNIEMIQIRDCIRQFLEILRKQDVLIHGKRSAFFCSFEHQEHHTVKKSKIQY